MPIVLIVDDSKTDQQLISQVIQKEEYDWIVDFSGSGEEAVGYLEQLAVDVVVTDMQMPGMSGLDLVDHVRRVHPTLPIILITEHEDNTLAGEALRRGAASYVPKRELASRLTEVIKQVVQVADGSRDFERVFHTLDDVQFRLTLENDPRLIPPLVNVLDQIAHRMQLCSERGRLRIGVAVDEALLNAMYHGNLELPKEELPETRALLRNGENVPNIDERREATSYAERRVHVEALINRERIQVTVHDDGTGFEVPRESDDSPTSAQHGLVLIRSLMDKAEFSERGSKVVMTKYKESEPEPEVID